MMGAEVEGWLFLKNMYVATFKLQVSITFSYAGELVSSRLHGLRSKKLMSVLVVDSDTKLRQLPTLPLAVAASDDLIWKL